MTERCRNNVLITGMSGTGKSTVLCALAAKGFETVDTDSDVWSEWVEIPHPHGATEHDWIWRAAWMTWLLTLDRPGPLFVGGCKSNQGSFYEHFDLVVLLSAQPAVMLERIEHRTGNEYDKHPAERDEILGYLETVEPLLRASSDREIDTSFMTIDEVVGNIIDSTQQGPSLSLT